MNNSNSKITPKSFISNTWARGLFAVLIFWSGAGEYRFAHGHQPSSVFESLQRSTSRLRELTPKMGFQGAQAETISDWLRSIDSNVSYLYEIARAQPNMRMSAEYTASLSSDARLLESITIFKTHSAKERDRFYKVLDEVSSDLRIKVSYSRSALGSPFRLVQVLVHTRTQDKEVGGYQVWYVPKGWADVRDEAKPFDRLSSPTYMDLPPGNYLMWTHKRGRNSKRQPVSLGDDGRSRREIDLPIE